MKLLLSPTFARALKRIVNKNPVAEQKVRNALKLLESDLFHPRLRTHKLKGALEEHWACTVDYDLRIVFEMVEHEGEQAVLLNTLGTHDEVY